MSLNSWLQLLGAPEVSPRVTLQAGTWPQVTPGNVSSSWLTAPEEEEQGWHIPILQQLLLPWLWRCAWLSWEMPGQQGRGVRSIQPWCHCRYLPCHPECHRQFWTAGTTFCCRNVNNFLPEQQGNSNSCSHSVMGSSLWLRKASQALENTEAGLAWYLQCLRRDKTHHVCPAPTTSKSLMFLQWAPCAWCVCRDGQKEAGRRNTREIF